MLNALPIHFHCMNWQNTVSKCIESGWEVHHLVCVTAAIVHHSAFNNHQPSVAGKTTVNSSSPLNVSSTQCRGALPLSMDGPFRYHCFYRGKKKTLEIFILVHSNNLSRNLNNITISKTFNV